MDSRMKKARPTEYKGIRYRSKSEAMFARYLELSSGERCILRTDYEPEFLEVDGWRPDFYTTSSVVYQKRLVLNYEIIEYKPSRPTATYISEFEERTDQILACDSFSDRTKCTIYWGSVFTKRRGHLSYHDGVLLCDVDTDCSGNDDPDDDWMHWYEDEIRETRFDLEVFETRTKKLSLPKSKYKRQVRKIGRG